MKTWSLALMLVASIAGCAVDASAPPASSDADDATEPAEPDAANGGANPARDRLRAATSLDIACREGNGVQCGPGPQPWHGEVPLTLGEK